MCCGEGSLLYPDVFGRPGQNALFTFTTKPLSKTTRIVYPPLMPPTTGMMINTNVRLLRPLKRGGMGSVWLADHLALRTQVAVKFMAEQLATDQEFTARFAREATAAAQIKSPHVVQVFDYGVTPEGTPFMVMELLLGHDLRSKIAQGKTIDPLLCAEIIQQAAKGLSRAHAAGVVHRDIKPDNIFISESEGEFHVKILDFGIAKQVHDVDSGMTGTGTMVGTPNYMSPEQVVSSRRVDFRTDLWSLAVVVYRCLTGVLPFQGETPGAVYITINQAEFVPATAINPRLPPAIDAWFSKALARDPAQRFSSAKELADTLLAVVKSNSFGADARMSMPAVPPRDTAPSVPPTTPAWDSNRLSTPSPSGAMHSGTPANPSGLSPHFYPSSSTHARPPGGKGLWLGIVVGGVVLVIATVIVTTLLQGGDDTTVGVVSGPDLGVKVLPSATAQASAQEAAVLPVASSAPLGAAVVPISSPAGTVKAAAPPTRSKNPPAAIPASSTKRKDHGF